MEKCMRAYEENEENLWLTFSLINTFNDQDIG